MAKPIITSTLPISQIEKRCSTCGKEKNLSEFNKKKGGKFGLRAECRDCQKKYYHKNKETIRIQKAAYHKANRDHILLKVKQYVESNRERVRIYQRGYNIKNIDTLKVKKKSYADSHKKERNKYLRERRQDITVRLNESLSSAISRSVKGNKNGRHWEDIVGWCLSDLQKHLERQFENSMTWDNYGEWHIDHKIPIVAHNFSNPEHIDFKKCWSLRNLQPMWGNDNLSKGAKIDSPFQPSFLF